MAHGDSGRIVIDVEPETKRQLYAALALSGHTLKHWFLKEASHFCEEAQQLHLFTDSRTASPNLTHSEKDTSMSIAQLPSRPMSVSYRSNGAKNRVKTFSVVSLFSGCGGMDLGFAGGFNFLERTYKRNPFSIIWANDISKAACDTYRHNIGSHVHCGDVWTMLDKLPASADVLIGGFPCQDISVNGKMAGANGSRSGLYKAMIEAIKIVKPKIFVAENVKGLLMKTNEASLRQIIRDFKGLGYEIEYALYNAADYGVPQTRERVFIVGTSSTAKPFIPPRPERSKENWITAKDALGDLEGLTESLEINHIWSSANKSPQQGNRRLIATRPGHTMRAECHGNIQFHYSLPRRLSMREAARIQSFPDNFIFKGGLRETERQVGNAVPPVLAWSMAQAVIRCL